MLRRVLVVERSNERVDAQAKQAEYSAEDETENQIEKDEDGIHVAIPQLSVAAALTPGPIISFYHSRAFCTTFRRPRPNLWIIVDKFHRIRE